MLAESRRETGPWLVQGLFVGIRVLGEGGCATVALVDYGGPTVFTTSRFALKYTAVSAPILACSELVCAMHRLLLVETALLPK